MSNSEIPASFTKYWQELVDRNDENAFRAEYFKLPSILGFKRIFKAILKDLQSER